MIGGKVRREGEGEAELRCEIRAEQARAQEPDRYSKAGTGYGADRLALRGLFEIRHQLDDVVWKRLGATARVSP